jgi:hypothetical protein
MSGHQGRNELIVRNKDTGELEVIDMYTGELVTTSSALDDEKVFVFRYELAMLICQEVAKGRTMADIGNDPDFPPLHVINHWKRSQVMFAEELKLARRQRAETYHDRVAEIAENAAELRYSSKEDIANAKLATDQYKWLAERGDPEKFGSKVTHEGSLEKPITMRVINTGINRKPDIESTAKEVHYDTEERDDEDYDSEDGGEEGNGNDFGSDACEVDGAEPETDGEVGESRE